MEATPDLSLLTLNASGELRYLGPSGGSYFAQYAANIARASIFKDGASSETFARRLSNIGQAEQISSRGPRAGQKVEAILKRHMIEYLLGAYFDWVHPLVPILSSAFREQVLERLSRENDQEQQQAWDTPTERVSLVIYYLVLALGAIHSNSHVKCVGNHVGYLEFQHALSTASISIDALYLKALDVLDSLPPMPQASVSMIQVLLLICTFGAYKPSGNRQWQLVGMAMRVS